MVWIVRCPHRLHSLADSAPSLLCVSCTARCSGQDAQQPFCYASIPSCYLERVAQRRPRHAGEPLRELADRLRTPLFEPGGELAGLSEGQQSQLQQQAKELAEVFQRSSSHVEGRNGYLSLRNHQLRG